MKRVVVVLAGLTVVASLASANSIFTFANWAQVGSTNAFEFNNTGVFSTIGSAVPVTFNLSVAGNLPLALQGSIAATMSMTLDTTAGAVVTSSYGGQNVNQPFNETGTIAFTLDTPITSGFSGCTVLNPCSNLLTVNVTQLNSAGLNGAVGQPTADLSGNDNTTGTYSDVFTFSSNFINFSSQADDTITMTFNSVSPCITNTSGPDCTNGDATPGVGGMLQTLTANGTGNFGAIPEPTSGYAPEPVTNVLTGSSLLGLAFYLRRKRSRT